MYTTVVHYESSSTLPNTVLVDVPQNLFLGPNLFLYVYSRPDRSSSDTRVAAESTPMTRRFLAPVVCATLHSFRATCLHVLMTSGYGCSPTGCTRHAKDGRSLVCVVSIRSWMNPWGWARTISSQFSLFQIWVSILTQTCRWTLTTHELFPAVLLFCDDTQHQSIRQSTRRAVADCVTGHFTVVIMATLAGFSAC